MWLYVVMILNINTFSLKLQQEQASVALTMVCVPAGVNPIQMSLIGCLTMAPRHPRKQDHRQMLAEQVNSL